MPRVALRLWWELLLPRPFSALRSRSPRIFGSCRRILKTQKLESEAAATQPPNVGAGPWASTQKQVSSGRPLGAARGEAPGAKALGAWGLRDPWDSRVATTSPGRK